MGFCLNTSIPAWICEVTIMYPGMGPRPRRLRLETVSKPIHGLVSVSRADVSVSASASISTFQVSSPLLFSLKFTCDLSLLKLSALISSIEASTIIRAECSRTLLSVLHRCIYDVICTCVSIAEVKSKLYYSAKNE